MNWIKSSFSAANGNCVQVAHDGEWTLVRDSKFPAGTQLRFTAAEWKAFVAGVHNGEFDWDVDWDVVSR